MSCEERFDVDIPRPCRGRARDGGRCGSLRPGAAQPEHRRGRGPRPLVRDSWSESIAGLCRLAQRRSADRDVLETRSSSVPAATHAAAGAWRYLRRHPDPGRCRPGRPRPAAAGAGPADPGCAAVWRPGSGTQWWRSGMTAAEFKAQDTTYFNQGLRIQSLAIRNGRFTAVWRPGSGTQWWRSGHDHGRVQGAGHDLLRPGPADQRSWSSDTAGFAAVWRPGCGAQWWRCRHDGRRVQGAGHDLLQPGPPDHRARDRERPDHRRLAARQRHPVVAGGDDRERVRGAGQPTSTRACGSTTLEIDERPVHGRLAARLGGAVVERAAGAASTSRPRTRPTSHAGSGSRSSS